MVFVSEEDSDVLRFLWVDDVGSDTPTTRVLRFARVVFGVSSSLFLLNATLQCHLNQYATYQTELVRRLTQSMTLSVGHRASTNSTWILRRSSEAGDSTSGNCEKLCSSDQ